MPFIFKFSKRAKIIGGDPVAGRVVDGDTLFAIGSASKAFTSTALGMLVDRGMADWKTRVHESDPDLKLSDPRATREIRLSDLPSNHSGLSVIRP